MSRYRTALPQGISRYGDLLVPAAVIMMVVMMVVPLPPVLLDLLLAFNLTLALVVVLVTMFTEEPLQFSIFPSLLLVTTLFRLALNVSSTRLILLRAYAGEIIRKFGEFVVGGNAVVGLIVFLILVIIQFVVITRGAERVAEVAARFTLDAMPGKQMAIDADLNAGLITEDQARQRRRNVEREADFYGAMDGASKFVKGDAIAGLIITVINIIGGIVTGVLQRGMALGDAAGTYSLLTVGDGLVSQIPALLISTATGIVVTRAASEASLGRDLAGQLLSQPKVMRIAACLLLGFAVIPGLPGVPFFVLGCLSLVLASALDRAARRAGAEEADRRREEELEAFRRPESVLSLLALDPLEIELGYQLVSIAEKGGGDLPERVSIIRRQLATELGMVVPPIRIVDNVQLPPQTYVIRLRGVEVARGELHVDRYLTMNPGVAEPVGIEGLATREPAFGLPAMWVKADDKERAELAGLTVVDPPSVLATHLTEVIRSHAHELLGRQEVQALLDSLKTRSPAVVEELVPSLLTLGEVQKVLQNLLREGVSIRDLATILETLADFARSTKDIDVLTEQVRQALSRMISSPLRDASPVQVVTLDPQLEQEIISAAERSETGTSVAVDPQVHRRMLTSLARETQRLSERGRPPVVLCSPLVRLYFKRLTERVARKLVVLSYNELDPDLQIEAVGTVKAS